MCFGSYASLTVPPAPEPTFKQPTRHQLRHAIQRAVRSFGGKPVHRSDVRIVVLDMLGAPLASKARADLVARIDAYLDASKKLGTKSAYKHKSGALRPRKAA